MFDSLLTSYKYIVTKVSDSSAKVTEELVQMVDDAWGSETSHGNSSV